jgi:hypothetical protein
MVKLDPEGLFNKIFENEPGGRRRMRRTRLRSLEDFERDLKRRRLKDGDRRQCIEKNEPLRLMKPGSWRVAVTRCR